jgi:hypothetical protein
VVGRRRNCVLSLLFGGGNPLHISMSSLPLHPTTIRLPNLSLPPSPSLSLSHGHACNGRGAEALTPATYPESFPSLDGWTLRRDGLGLSPDDEGHGPLSVTPTQTDSRIRGSEHFKSC